MKTPLRHVCLAALLNFASCSSPTKVAAPLPAEGKPTAPVSAEATLDKKQAQLSVRFHDDGKDVNVFVSGIDGLTLASKSNLLAEGKVARGELRQFRVDYDNAPAGSALVLSVEGTFSGQRRVRVMTFTVKEGPLPDTGTVIRTDDGDAVKVMPTK